MSKSGKRTEVNRTATRKGSAAPVADEVSTDAEVTRNVEESNPETTGSESREEARTGRRGSTALRRSRDKGEETGEKELSERARRREAKKAMQMGNPAWFVPVMLSLFIIGLIWIVVFYLTQMAYPVPGIHYWNLAIGFGLIMLGFAMTTRWK